MGVGEKLRSAADTLITAADVLRRATNAQPALEGPGRTFGRIAEAVNRPLRLGILGETNSGKSSLVNLLIGTSVLPAHPVKNTRLPTLLKYAPAPFVTAVYGNGETIALPIADDIPQALADLYENGGTLLQPASENVPQDAIKRLEVGVPSGLLRSVEILDCPGSADALSPVGSQTPARHDMDAAIWTTVATQAWRASEQTQWLELPEAVRARGLLAVTYCDMIAGGKKDLKKLQARLETSAKPHFRGMCFVDARNGEPAAAVSRNEVLFALLQYLTEEFSAQRLDKALAIGRRVMRKAIEGLGREQQSAAPMAGAAGDAEANDAADGDITTLKAFLKDWPESEFAEEARARIKELRGPAVTRRGVLVGVGAGAAVAVVGGAVATMYAAKETPAEPPQPFRIDRPVLTFTAHQAWIHSVAFSRDGRTLLSGSGDNVLKLWDAASGAEFKSFVGFPDGVRSATFAPDGRTILCGGDGNTVILLDGGTGKVLRTFRGHSDGIPTVAFSPDGLTALSGSWDKTLKLWDVAGGDALRTFNGHTGEVHAVAFSPDGLTALSGSRDKTLRLWDVATGEELHVFRGHADWISAAAFSPDGRTALSSSTDKTVRLWDIVTGEELRVFPAETRDFSPVAFSPNARAILSGGYAALKLWDAATGRELGTFKGHAGGITVVAISPDGRTAVSGSVDKTLKLWDMTSGALASVRR